MPCVVPYISTWTWDKARNVSSGRRSGLESDLESEEPCMIIQVPLPHQLLYIASQGGDRMLPSSPLDTQVITIGVEPRARVVCNANTYTPKTVLGGASYCASDAV